ncbi:MAG: hypothetical protein NTW03_11740 [Verrucomicrobia bacterium]|nr:hypothetical protein [Verrucomicrobiota bacterium]
MNLRANGGKLAAITMVLSNQWQQTRDSWQDAKGQEFERKYMDELRAGVDKACVVIEQLDKLVMKVRRDCE